MFLTVIYTLYFPQSGHIYSTYEAVPFTMESKHLPFLYYFHSFSTRDRFHKNGPQGEANDNSNAFALTPFHSACWAVERGSGFSAVPPDACMFCLAGGVNTFQAEIIPQAVFVQENESKCFFAQQRKSHVNLHAKHCVAHTTQASWLRRSNPTRRWRMLRRFFAVHKFNNRYVPKSSRMQLEFCVRFRQRQFANIACIARETMTRCVS